MIKSLQVLTQTPESEKSAGNFRFIQGFYRYRCGQSDTNQQTNTTTLPNTASPITTSTSNNQQSTTNSAAPTSSKSTNSSTQTSSQSVSSAASTIGMNTVDDVKKFQLFLDKNYPGWHDKYGTLGTNTARGHGKFGPRTKRWFDWVGEKFLMDELGTEVKPTGTSSEPSNETPKQTSQSPSDVPPTTTSKENPSQGFQKFVQGEVGTVTQGQPSTSAGVGPKSKGLINPDMDF